MGSFPFPVLARTGRQRAFRLRGQSLMQLMAVLAIAGILLGSGAPSVQSLVQEQRLVTHVNRLFGDLQLARSEAIKRGASIVLCKSSDGIACSTTASWQDGWLMFVDADDDRIVDAGETVLRVQQALDGNVTLRFGINYRYVHYKPDGVAWPNATFTFCDACGAGNVRAIVVSNTGRARISNEAASGGALVCS